MPFHLLSAATFVLLALTLKGQSYDLSKKLPGSILTKSNDSLVGQIVLDNNWQSVSFVSDRSMRQLYARDIDKVLLEDGYQMITYHSVKIENQGDYFLFQRLTDGPVVLLRYAGELYKDEKEAGQFYIELDDQAFKLPSEKSIFNVFGKYKKEMRDYAFSMAFNLDLERDLILLFNYYNDTFGLGES